MIWRGSSGGFEAHRDTAVPSASDSPSLPTTEGKSPRGSRGPDKGKLRSWGVVASSTRKTGAQAAERLLSAAGVEDVQIEEMPGFLSGHYDPPKKCCAFLLRCMAAKPFRPSALPATRPGMRSSARLPIDGLACARPRSLQTIYPAGCRTFSLWRDSCLTLLNSFLSARSCSAPRSCFPLSRYR
jgi:hypothetical protein